MTAPASVGDASSTRLAAVARWDVSLVRSAVAVLDAVAARLPVRRAGLAEVGRTMQQPDCWTGPAARAAAASVLEISAVAAAVDGAVAESLGHLQRLAREVDAAQELAAAALRTVPPGWNGDLASSARLAAAMDLLVPGSAPPQPDPAGALVLAALEHAALALAAATAAAEPVGRLGDLGSGRGATFGDLAADVALRGAEPAPPVPVRSRPPEVAAWWAGLSLPAQLAAVHAAPTVLGRLDGLPAWARDRANRLVLARALREPAVPSPARAVAREVDRRLAAEELRGRQAQLHLLDLAGDRVVLGLGDLDTADAVALLVPGVGNSPGDDLGDLVRHAADVAAAARAAAPDLAVATVVWLGYRPPGFPGLAARTAARTGGAALARDLDGLSAARAVTGRPPPRTTVLAHSYGTVVVDEAADEAGRLRADAVVLLGSPGMEDDARSLEVADVFDAGSPLDAVTALGYFGSPTSVAYGSTALPLDPWTGHSDYYDRCRPTLGAIGEVVAGVRRTG
jgi:hypothetical protein